MTINDLNMTEEQIVNEIQSMRLFDKYLQKMLGMEKYNELCLGFARMMTSAELKSFGASDEEIKKACNFADMMAIADEHKADTPQTDCETCSHYKLACELFSEVCKYEPTTQTETQNSNLTFDTPQTESTGSPIGDYRDGVGAWQTDRMTEEEFDTKLAKVLVGQTDCGWGEPRNE